MSNFITDGVQVAALENALSELQMAQETTPHDGDINVAIEATKRAIVTAKKRLSKSSRGFVTP